MTLEIPPIVLRSGNTHVNNEIDTLQNLGPALGDLFLNVYPIRFVGVLSDRSLTPLSLSGDTQQQCRVDHA